MKEPPDCQLLGVSVEAKTWIATRNRGKEHHRERLQGINCKRERSDARMTANISNYFLTIRKSVTGYEVSQHNGAQRNFV